MNSRQCYGFGWRDLICSKLPVQTPVRESLSFLFSCSSMSGRSHAAGRASVAVCAAPTLSQVRPSDDVQPRRGRPRLKRLSFTVSWYFRSIVNTAANAVTDCALPTLRFSIGSKS